MTLEQGFRLTTRALTVYSLFWLVDEILLLPADIHGLLHYVRPVSAVVQDPYWIRYYGWLSCERLIKISLSLWAATFFYCGGPTLRRFFGANAASVLEE